MMPQPFFYSLKSTANDFEIRGIARKNYFHIPKPPFVYNKCYGSTEAKGEKHGFFRQKRTRGKTKSALLGA